MINIESDGKTITIFGRDENGTRYIENHKFTPYFYIPDDAGEHISLFGDTLKRIDCENTYELVKKRKEFPITFESDVPHANKFVIDNYESIAKEPIRACFLDIETEDRDGFPDIERANKPILSIAFYDTFSEKYTILITSPTKTEKREQYEITLEDEQIPVNHIEFKTENEMLANFIKIVQKLDFDIFYAWNGEGFDYPYIWHRLQRLKLPITNISPIKQLNKRSGNPRGRAFLDLMLSHRKLSTQEMESYSLDYIGFMECGIRKVEHEERIGEMWERDIEKFIKYNIKDVYIMVKIEKKKDITDYFDTIRRLTYCSWDDLLWNSKVLDIYALKFAKNLGVVLPNKQRGNEEQVSIQGARVLIPKVGIHRGVAVLDIKSLYPSAILTCNMSPETIIDENYAKDYNIEYCKVGDICFRLDKLGFVPQMVKTLWDLRQQFKSERNKYEIGMDEYNKYDNLQTVCKFLLNSIYGVLLLKIFRLFKREVGASVTRFGREYNEFMEDFIKKSGHEPIYGDSVTKDTQIDIVGKGRISIQDLFTHVDYSKNGKEYCNLTNVYTPTIDDNGNCINKRVPYIMRHKTDKKIYRIWKDCNTYVNCTEDHSLITFERKSKGGQCLKDRFKYISPINLLSSKSSLIQQKIFDDTIYDNDDIPIEVYQFIGLFLGDGNFENNSNGKCSRNVSIACGLDKDEIVNEYIKPLMKLGWIDRIKDHGVKGDIRVYGKISEYLIENFRVGESNKMFDLSFLKLKSSDKISATIRGLFDSDGTVLLKDKNPIIRFTSIEEDFCKQLIQYLKRIGIAASYFKETKSSSFNGKNSGTYSCHVFIKSKLDFKNKVGFKIKMKNDRLETIISNGRYHQNDVVTTGKPYKVELIEYDDYVYDIEVEDTHRFFANDILVSNTDSIAFKLNERTFGKRITEAEMVNDGLNAVNAQWCEETWGSAKYNKIESEFEQIYKALINLPSRDGKVAKKRYVGLVNYKDGTDLRKHPELCIKGINAKRSDTPTILRDLMKEIFTMVLNGQYDEAKERLENVRFKITRGDYTPEELASPKGMSKAIDEYTGTVPIHIRGAKYANAYCGENIKREKIKFIYVKETHHKPGAPPTNVISFTERFPSEYYEPNWVLMAEKLIDYQYDTLYKCMGWNIKELQGQVSLAAFM